MNHFEVEKTLRTMVVLVDTREQDTPRLRKRLEGLRCPFERVPLRYGDYTAKCTLPSGAEFSLADKLVVERKMSATEVCGNFTRERSRFSREFERAREDGAKVVLLMECADWKSVYGGEYRSKLTPNALVASLLSFEHRYDMHIHYITPELTGRFIYDCLYYGLREHLSVTETPDEHCG